MKENRTFLKLLFLSILVTTATIYLYFFLYFVLFANESSKSLESLLSPNGQSITYKAVFAVFATLKSGSVSVIALSFISIAFCAGSKAIWGAFSKIPVWSVVIFSFLVGGISFIIYSQTSSIYHLETSERKMFNFIGTFSIGFLSNFIPALLARRYDNLD